MSTVRYTEDHEWIRLGDDGIATVGITDYAQQQLGDVVFVDLPEVGKAVEKGGEAAVVESVKAASEVYAPLDGEVTAVNDAIADDPSLVNTDPTGEGWFVKIKPKDAAALDAMMDEDAYARFVEGLD